MAAAEIPAHLVCPLSKQPMMMPVLVTKVSRSDLSVQVEVGDTVDSKALLEICGWDFSAVEFVPNRGISSAIEDFWSSQVARRTPIDAVKDEDVHLMTAAVLGEILRLASLKHSAERAKRLASEPSRPNLFALVSILARRDQPWIRASIPPEVKNQRAGEVCAAPDAKRRRLEKGSQSETAACAEDKLCSRDPTKGKFVLIVTTLTGKMFPIPVTLGTTIDELRQKIQEKEGVPPDQQRIIFLGKELQGPIALGQYAKWTEMHPDACRVHLILKLRGGMEHVSTHGRRLTRFVPLYSDNTFMCSVGLELEQQSEAKLHAAVVRGAVLKLCSFPSKEFSISYECRQSDGHRGWTWGADFAGSREGSVSDQPAREQLDPEGAGAPPQVESIEKFFIERKSEALD